MATKPLHEILNGETRFGRLTVLGDADPAKWGGKSFRMVHCRCDCGKARTVQAAKLRSGQTVSCGCYAAERASRENRTHGMTRSREYSSWRSMISRCYYPKDVSYFRYGAQGITVCDRWRESFEAFYDDMGPRPPRTSIDRVDGRGNYEPSNCRWASPKVQADNTRAARKLKTPAGTINMSEAARRSGVTTATLRKRIAKGIEPVDAMALTGNGARRKSNNRYIEYRGRTMLFADVCEDAGVDHGHLGYHLKQGRTADEAVALIVANRSKLAGHCKNGHEMDDANTYIDPRGHSQCRACRKAANRRHSGRE